MIQEWKLYEKPTSSGLKSLFSITKTYILQNNNNKFKMKNNIVQKNLSILKQQRYEECISAHKTKIRKLDIGNIYSLSSQKNKYGGPRQGMQNKEKFGNIFNTICIPNQYLNKNQESRIDEQIDSITKEIKKLTESIGNNRPAKIFPIKELHRSRPSLHSKHHTEAFVLKEKHLLQNQPTGLKKASNKVPSFKQNFFSNRIRNPQNRGALPEYRPRKPSLTATQPRESPRSIERRVLSNIIKGLQQEIQQIDSSIRGVKVAIAYERSRSIKFNQYVS